MRNANEKRISLFWCIIIILCIGIIVLNLTGIRTTPDARAASADVSAASEKVSISRLKSICEEAATFNVGKIVSEENVDFEQLNNYFTINEISDSILSDIVGKSYVENGDISINELRYLKVLHYNYNHEIQVGELIVNEKIAEDCKNIFLELFSQEYEIHSMYLIDKFWTGDGVDSDTKSIENNNTSAFNYRAVPGTEQLSKHAMGFAIDINPLQNPYIQYGEDGTYGIHYKDMEKYVDRSLQKEHMITHEDNVYQVFTKYGFAWGGDWVGPKDYQHFQKVME